MANVNGKGLQISDFDPKAVQASGLPDIPRGGSPAAEALASTANTFAAQVGRLGDALAEAEGTKAGKIAGADPNWRPSDDMTIKGRAFDKAASEVYLSKLASNFQGDALDLYQKNKDDPAGFKQAYEGLVGQYKRQHVFPEAAGWFDAKSGDIANSLRVKVLDNWEASQKDLQRAEMIRGTSATNANVARLLTIDPNSAAAEREAMRGRDENIARIKALVASDGMTAAAGEKAILAEQDAYHTKIINARAGVLRTADEIDAYRAKLRKDFGENKLPGLQDFDSLDSSLASLSKAKRVQADHTSRELDGKISDFLTRYGKGDVPPSDEWLKLEDQARALGSDGAAKIDSARRKLKISNAIAALSLPEADALVADMERAAKNSGGDASAARDYLHSTSAHPGRAGDTSGLHPVFANNLAAAIKEARAAGLNVGLGSGWRSAGETGSAYDADGWSLHDKGGAADISGLDGPGGAKTKQWAAIAARHGIVNPYGVDNASEFNHWQMVDYKLEHRPDVVKAIKTAGADQAKVWAAIAPIGDGVVDKGTSELLDHARSVRDAKRTLINQDQEHAAEIELRRPATFVDFTAKPDALSQQMRARVTNADAVADAYKRAPQYIRPDEKPAVQAVLHAGGEKALDLIDGVIRGSGAKATKVLAELGGDAPELAHAGAVTLSTGDRSFARQVAAAIEARNVAGATRPKIDDAALETEARTIFGPSLQNIDPTERQRTMAAAKAWAEREFVKRNVDPTTYDKAAGVYQEAIQRARGQSVVSGEKFGGVGPVAQDGFWGSSTRVQVPADVRADKFGDALAAIRDEDLKALRNPPVLSDGSIMPASQLRRYAPFATPGGYLFGTLDKLHSRIDPLLAKDGSAFILPWAEISATLRTRVPSAFR